MTARVSQAEFWHAKGVRGDRMQLEQSRLKTASLLYFSKEPFWIDDVRVLSQGAVEEAARCGDAPGL